MTNPTLNQNHLAFLRKHPGLAECLAAPHSIIEDIGRRFLDYGSMSDKQIALVFKLASECWAPAKPPAAPVPVVEGRMVIEGKVVSLKWRSGQWGDQLKMVVQSDQGFKVWGTVPSAIADDVEVGNRVSFTASVEVSEEDNTFGFFKRPRCAEIRA